jgi:hypothetical protein
MGKAAAPPPLPGGEAHASSSSCRLLGASQALPPEASTCDWDLLRNK